MRLMVYSLWQRFRRWVAARLDLCLPDEYWIDERLPRIPLETRTVKMKFKIGGEGKPRFRTEVLVDLGDSVKRHASDDLVTELAICRAALKAAEGEER